MTTTAVQPAAEVTQRVRVSFSGEGSGTGELSWGQREIWQAMVRQNSWLPMGGWRRLEPGTTVADISEELRYLLNRYPSMRTKLVFGAPQGPHQVVHAAGEIEFEIIDAPETDLDVLAEAIKDRYQDTPYDFAAQWPVRMGVLRRDGELTHMIAIMCHLVADGLGAMVMMSEMGARPAEPSTGLAPLAQAQWQRSPAGQRQNASALRHWENTLRSVPDKRFPGSPAKCEPRHYRGDFTSPALRLATHALTERAQAGSAEVILTLFALAMARVTGINPVVIRPMVSNRFRPGLSNVVAMVAQFGLCALDVGDVSFTEALSRVNRATMTAYKNAYYDPAALEELIGRLEAERGPDFAVGAFFNDRRVQTGQGFAGPAPSAAEIEAAVPQARFGWTIRQHDPFERLIVHVEDVPGAFNVVVFMDTDDIAPADGERLLREMERIAVEAAR
jgi:hypothetical protein